MKYAKQIMLILVVAITSMSYAQDGEKLFKAKCNTCHALGKNSTGPDLKGVKQKWEDAGEGDLIYEWVKNPQTLIASGKSTVAMKTKEYSPTDMTPQAVTNEEIDAILSFIDGWTPPVTEGPTNPDGTGGKVIKYVPDYESNLDLFYALATLLIVQLIGIFILGNSLTSIVKLEITKRKGDKLKMIAIAIGLFTLMATNNQALALKFTEPGATQELTPWLLVEDSDIYFMIALNILALGILLYMRRSFMEMMRSLRPEAFVVKRSKRKKTVNQILTDVVPIEEEGSILMHHEYDGIQELDNNLPPWWVWGFYFSIGFAIVYLFNYHVLGLSDLQVEAYNKDVKRAQKEVAAYMEKMAMNVDETSATLMTDSKDLSAGKSIFDANCVVCHNPNGEGNIGPNLTDKNWIYGYDIKEVFATVKNGTSKGMPEHNSKLNPIQIQQVASYVLSLPETPGKDPEGDIVKEE